MKEKLKKILLWSQKYTKTDMLYLTKSSFWLLIGQGIQLISGLILLVSFANLLPKESYGVYQFIISVAAILSSFTLTGMNTAVIRALAKGNEGSFRYGFRIKMVWSTAITISGAAVAAYYFFQGNNSLGIAFLLVGALTPFIEAFSINDTYFLGKQLFKEGVLFGLWRKLFPFLVIVITLVITNNPIILIFSYLASTAVAAGSLYLMILKKYKPPPGKDEDTLEYSKHLSVMNIISRFSQNLDQVLIFHFLGPVAVATYFIALNPIKRIENTASIFTKLTIPKLASVDMKILQKTLPYKVAVFEIIMILFIVLYIVLAPFIFSLFFPTYIESVHVTQALSVTLLALPRRVLSNALGAHKKTRELYILHISTAILHILSIIIFVPIWGLWGAVFSLWATLIFSTILIVFLFAKAKEIPL